MARAKNLVSLRSPDPSCSSVSVEGVEYEGNKGFFQVAPHHAAALEAKPFRFKRVEDGAADQADDDAANANDFKAMSKAELIDFIVARGEQADRKMSKEQLIAAAESVKDKPADEDEE